MITNKELNEISLSPTKKDYYQIWNELIDLASKISDRWSPESTNESDPGIVLLKALTAIADKINYNIDKNTLEAFMPSATQAESMRKLTEMMGYSMKHYISATCDATITYTNSNNKSSFKIYFPKFVNLKDTEEEINFVTIEDFTLTDAEPARQIPCIEGELVECETNSDNIISMTQLDDNNRYFLPEMTVAENGIFITNVYEAEDTSRESESWIKVDNLNSQLPGAQVFKFGISSERGLPYIQFPDDISQIIGDGIRIRYIRTDGINGNIKTNTLSKLEIPALWSTADDEDIKSLTANDFKITNTAAAKNGADPESITAAYNNFKKTVGTFDTLITCRDYMNKIYQLTESQTDPTPLVSNALVSDIRNDINNSYCLCSFNDYGICYSNKAIERTVSDPDSSTKKDITLNNFELILYPFKTIYGLNTKDEYVNSFKYDASNNPKIKAELELNKTIAHDIQEPKEKTDICCIKNYLKIKAKITTIKKVTVTEEVDILAKIKQAIYSNFNMRKLDFGEEIPYDSICEVIRYADTRIKDVTVDDPELITKFMDSTNNEYAVASTNSIETSSSEALDHGDTLYNKLVLRNVLAGRIAAFQYDESFATNYAEKSYDYEETVEGETTKYASYYDNIINLKSSFELPVQELNNKGYKLAKNEVIQFRTTNFKTAITYPAYVNYYIKLSPQDQTQIAVSAIPATFMGLETFLKHSKSPFSTFIKDPEDDYNNYWEEFVNEKQIEPESGKKAGEGYILFTKNENEPYRLVTNPDATQSYYGFRFKTDNAGASEFSALYAYIGSLLKNKNDIPETDLNSVTTYETLKSAWTIYRSLGFNTSHQIGKLVDDNLIKYTPVTNNKSSNINEYFVPELHPKAEAAAGLVTIDGLGRSLELNEVLKNAEYQLKDGEYLLINYTETKTSEDSSQETKQVINKYYGKGTIIKANFALIDSDIYASSHTASKKTGYDFSNWVQNPAGMFTLGTNEQICIREPAAIRLFEPKKDNAAASKRYYIYFIRNDDVNDIGRQYFTFDEHYDTTDIAYNAYTLKEGEYVFFTDSSKMNLGYYGNGTTVIITNNINHTNDLGSTADKNNDEIYKDNNLGKVSYEDIIQNGITAIPWGTAYDFNEDFNLTFIENQYISLTEGDTLISISGEETDGDSITNDWKTISGAKYQLTEAETSDELPKINIDGYNWKVRSRLDFNMGPSVGQTLNKYDSITITYQNGNTKVEKELRPLTQNGTCYPLTLFSNYQCQLAHHVYTPNKNLTSITPFKLKPPFKLKLADIQNPADSQKHINLNNYTDGVTEYTKINVEEFENTDNAPLFTLNINIPEDRLGLVMFYYIGENTPRANAAYLVAKDNEDNEIAIGQYNNAETTTNPYHLKHGIQVIELSPEIKTLSVYPDMLRKSTIIFSKLSLVEGINPLLDYRYSATGQTDRGLKDLLDKIKEVDPNYEFFYNTPIDNNRAIDLNHLVGENLASPVTWYDPNNENNKFVISEIDADSLDTGITLTKASRY